jgi:L-lactate dehydrogenase complex protein LldF
VLATASSLCNACEEVCPVKIPIPELIRRIRNESYSMDPASKVAGHGYKSNWIESLTWKLWAIANTFPLLNSAGIKTMSVLGQKLPNVGPLKHWTRYRKAPEFAPRSLHELVKQNGVDNE